MVAIRGDLDHHISATFFLVNIDWARLIRQVHVWIREISRKLGVRRAKGEPTLWPVGGYEIRNGGLNFHFSFFFLPETVSSESFFRRPQF